VIIQSFLPNNIFSAIRAYTGVGKIKKLCNIQDHVETCERQREGSLKTTIPWCLAHTATKNGNWNGAMGRLHPRQPFPTIVTSLAPLKSNGRIIHPTNDRFVTVLEVARAQTFPDTFHFDANCKKALKQVSFSVFVVARSLN
jgi:site-specific DNA-cytosine methylase